MSRSHSRDATPSTTSDGPSASGSSQSQGLDVGRDVNDPPPGSPDVDRFLKRMDMEKKMQTLQQRLELASMKTNHGWSDLSINQIEQLPLARRRSHAGPPPIRVEPYPHASPSGSHSARYAPPSPSRPWQLSDVLWQPLPPPSNPGSPAGPASPRKRPRESGHRRASSGTSMGMVMERRKDRSYSHSTTADVNAAKALTHMHRPEKLRPTSSLPVPGTPERPRSASIPRRAKDREDRGRAGDDEDTSAAELMMFLAHSPSPLRPTSTAPRPSPTTARVLFGEERNNKSGLGAPPITSSDFGGFL